MEAEKVKKKRGPAPGSTYNMTPPMLRDMRWAYKYVDDKRVGTANQEHFRRMYRKSPAAFIAALDRLERLELPNKKKNQARPEPPAPNLQPAALPAQPAADLGEAKCVELVERLLEEGGWNRADARGQERSQGVDDQPAAPGNP